MNDDRQEFVNGLRELADFYEARPELPLPSNQTLYIWGSRGEDVKDEVASFAKMFGKADKDASYNYFTLSRKFGRINLEATWHRDEVCKRVVVGRETVEEEVPTGYETREVTRDVVEWKCPKILEVT